jgi:hypothetical protein
MTVLRNIQTDRHYSAWLDDDTGEVHASLISDTSMSPRARLTINQPGLNLEPVLKFVLYEVDTRPRLTIHVEDGAARALAMLLGSMAESENPIVVEAWTRLKFELTAWNSTATGHRQSIRFLNRNIAGIKKLERAEAIELTITKKQ